MILVSFSVGLSGLLRYAIMKSVPGLVTMISRPSNLTSMSMRKPLFTEKGRRPKPTPQRGVGLSPARDAVILAHPQSLWRLDKVTL